MVDAKRIIIGLKTGISNVNTLENKRPSPRRFQRNNIGFQRISSTLSRNIGMIGTLASVAIWAKPFPRMMKTGSTQIDAEQ